MKVDKTIYSTRVKGEGIQVVVMLRLALDEPLNMKEVVYGAGELEGPCGVKSIHFFCLLQQPLEQGVVEIGYGNHKLLEAAFFAFQSHPH